MNMVWHHLSGEEVVETSIAGKNMLLNKGNLFGIE